MRAEKPAKRAYKEGGERSGAHGVRVMMPNDKRKFFIEEDWSEPALLKRGVHEMDVDGSYNRHRSGRLGDLYSQVEETMKEDAAAFDKLTDPHNW